jgi:hypothetical protein
MGLVLGSTLALTATTGFDPVRTQPVAAGVAQYCAPTHDDPDALRFYCRNEDACSSPTGAATLSCLM